MDRGAQRAAAVHAPLAHASAARSSRAPAAVGFTGASSLRASRYLRDRGFEYAVTHAHEATSAPVLEHVGFETLFTATSWSLTP